MEAKKLLEEIGDKKEGLIILGWKGMKGDHPERVRQPALDIKLMYILDGEKICEEDSGAETPYEADSERAKILNTFEKALKKEGYRCKIVDDGCLYFEKG